LAVQLFQSCLGQGSKDLTTLCIGILSVPERETLVSAADRLVLKQNLFSLISRGGQLVWKIIGRFHYSQSLGCKALSVDLPAACSHSLRVDNGGSLKHVGFDMTIPKTDFPVNNLLLAHLVLDQSA
jgi:hypothetical protein